jgi:octaprenyl-diphosphate synthase
MALSDPRVLAEAAGAGALERLLAATHERMQRVNALILARAESHVEMVPELARYLIEAGGKRLRPMLTIAAAQLFGRSAGADINYAAAVEFMHNATLLHDDVVDESTLRRGRATANQNFGNPASVLVGDFLYSRAFQMMLDAHDMRVMEILAEATNVIAEGEVLQLMNMHDPGLDEAAYLQVIRSKTAKLFEASARLGAVLSGAGAGLEQACADYGQALGTAFQVIDDVLDYAGDAQELGKNLGDDLREGKVTLPLIAAMRRGTASQRALIRHAIETGGLDELQQIIAIVRETGALEVAQEAAAGEAERAMSAAAQLPQNEHARALLQLAASLLQRRN